MKTNKPPTGLTRLKGSNIWHIDKQLSRMRLCESTGTSDRETAEDYLVQLLKDIIRSARSAIEVCAKHRKE